MATYPRTHIIVCPAGNPAISWEPSSFLEQVDEGELFQRLEELLNAPVIIVLVGLPFFFLHEVRDRFTILALEEFDYMIVRDAYRQGVNIVCHAADTSAVVKELGTKLLL